MSEDDSRIGKWYGRVCRYQRDPYAAGDAATYMCAGIRVRMSVNGIGLIAPRVAACAAHEANKVLQLIMQTES